MEHKNFKPFEKVLVKDTGEWNCAFYSHWSEENNAHFITALVDYKDDKILPFEGNEHLLGTCDEQLIKIGELCYGFDMLQDLDNYEDIVLGKFEGIDEHSDEVMVSTTSVVYCIPYSKFYPYDMESTKKEILTVSPHTHKLVKLIDQKKDSRGTLVTGY